MKVKYLILFFLILCESVNAQIPGTPVFMRSNPQLYTYSAAVSNLTTATVTGQVLTNGQPLLESGVIWGTSPTLTIESATASVTFSSIAGTLSATITGLSAGSNYYVALYAKTSNVTTIGNVIQYEHGTVTTSTGRKWLQWNLGATNYPPSMYNDKDNYGNLYQWGRGNDGSQYNATNVTLSASQYYTTATVDYYNSTSKTIVTNSTTNLSSYNGDTYTLIGTPTISKYVQTSSSDWFLPSYDGLWQGVNGINNPCPTGYRVPTATEFNAEITGENITNTSSAFSSSLKLTSAGYRNNTGPTMTDLTTGYYWTSTVSSSTSNHTFASALVIGSSASTYSSSLKSAGYALRCIKDDGNFSSSGGTAKVASYSCPSTGFSGSIRQSVSVSGVKQTITANVTTAGTYSLKAYLNGITFAKSGTFTGTGSQTIELIATGTAMAGGEYTIALQNISPSCDFNVPIVDTSSGGTALIRWKGFPNLIPTNPSTEYNENYMTLPALTELSSYSPPYVHNVGAYVNRIGTFDIDAVSTRIASPPTDAYNTGFSSTIHLKAKGSFTTKGQQLIKFTFSGSSSIYYNPQTGIRDLLINQIFIPNQGLQQVNLGTYINRSTY